MEELARLLTLLALAGGALTLLGGAVVWFLDEGRRIRRTLTEGLDAVPQPLLIARGRGAGIGFDLSAGRVCVAWDKGGWRLDYRLDELTGVELIVDRQVAARAFRGEPRRPLDQLADPAELVRLRFVFDDPGYPDFNLDLWRLEDEGRRGRLDADGALHEANSWMSRMESLLRRPVAKPAAAPAPIATRPPPVAAGPLFDDDAFEDDSEDAIN
ncbi:hypothetical protein [Phenylobacterium sp.]|uniref:hypothetical protein n=1 Tax=Phenylobacterium sp. TaxID=1871053 RepID=UPI002ED9E9DB